MSYTNQQKYDAIMKASDFIERNPKRYYFGGRAVVNMDGGCTACMWGWVGYFLGLKEGDINCDVSEAVLGHDRTAELYDLRRPYLEDCDYPKHAVAILRRFAKQFKTAEPALDSAYLAFRATLQQGETA